MFRRDTDIRSSSCYTVFAVAAAWYIAQFALWCILHYSRIISRASTTPCYPWYSLFSSVRSLAIQLSTHGIGRPLALLHHPLYHNTVSRLVIRFFNWLLLMVHRVFSFLLSPIITLAQRLFHSISTVCKKTTIKRKTPKNSLKKSRWLLYNKVSKNRNYVIK